VDNDIDLILSYHANSANYSTF